MGSARLPGKVLADIGGRTLLQRVLDRVRIVPGAAVVVATPAIAEDDPIASQAASEHVGVFRGSLSDVANRALSAAEAFGLDRFARVCADRPFVDPVLLRRALECSVESGADIVSTTRPADSPQGSPTPTVPAGLTTEVIRTDALRQLMATTDNPADREHVTRAFYRFPSAFHHVLVEVGPGAGRQPLVVDTATDLRRSRAVMRRLGPEPHRATMEEVAKATAAVALDP